MRGAACTDQCRSQRTALEGEIATLEAVLADEREVHQYSVERWNKAEAALAALTAAHARLTHTYGQMAKERNALIELRQRIQARLQTNKSDAPTMETAIMDRRAEHAEAALAEEHRISRDDPAEQRAERYAMEASELTLKLIAAEKALAVAKGYVTHKADCECSAELSSDGLFFDAYRQTWREPVCACGAAAPRKARTHEHHPQGLHDVCAGARSRRSPHGRPHVERKDVSQVGDVAGLCRRESRPASASHQQAQAERPPMSQPRTDDRQRAINYAKRRLEYLGPVYLYRSQAERDHVGEEVNFLKTVLAALVTETPRPDDTNGR